MTVTETLTQLPDEYQVVLKAKGSGVILNDTASGWLNAHSPDELDTYYEVVTELHVPEPEDTRFVDIIRLVNGEFGDHEWLVEPILPKGKLVGLVSKRGVGKSLLALDLTCRLAAGHPFLDQPAGPPIHVLYLDYEMGYEDLQERLFDLGWTADNPDLPLLAEHLHYAQLPELPPLDTEEGGEALIALVDETGSALVVVDTVSRVISGDENAAEPYRDMFRHTERWIRGRGATVLRLDHLGKDTAKGSRGSSAKEDPLDVVWQLEESAVGTLVLKLTKNRPGWVPLHVTIHREDNDGEIVHTKPVEFVSDVALAIAQEMDDLDMPFDIGRKKAQAEFYERTGRKRNNNYITEAIRFRKGRGPLHVVHPAGTPSKAPGQGGYSTHPPKGGYMYPVSPSDEPEDMSELFLEGLE